VKIGDKIIEDEPLKLFSKPLVQFGEITNKKIITVFIQLKHSTLFHMG
jgi:hypothetical protein